VSGCWEFQRWNALSHTTRSGKPLPRGLAFVFKRLSGELAAPEPNPFTDALMVQEGEVLEKLLNERPPTKHGV